MCSLLKVAVSLQISDIFSSLAMFSAVKYLDVEVLLKQLTKSFCSLSLILMSFLVFYKYRSETNLLCMAEEKLLTKLS